MEHWGPVEWGAVLAAGAVIFAAIGSVATTFIHGYRATARVFERIEALEKMCYTDHRKVKQLYGIAQGTGVIRKSVSIEAIDEEEEDP